jgi:PD-(D/E)XK endonuclease
MKKRRPKIIQDKKQRGEWAEMRFMARAAENGLAVSKPWGEMRPFDFVVGKTGRFISVQVKSTVCEYEAGYDCTVRGGHKAYPAGSFDFVAAYVVPVDVWYIIPAEAIRGKRSVMLYPELKTAKYEPYREAWHLLREATEARDEAEAGGEAETSAAEVTAEEAAAEAAPAVQPRAGPPRNALERMEAAFNFVRGQLERGGVRTEKRSDESDA